MQVKQMFINTKFGKKTGCYSILDKIMIRFDKICIFCKKNNFLFRFAEKTFFCKMLTDVLRTSVLKKKVLRHRGTRVLLVLCQARVRKVQTENTKFHRELTRPKKTLHFF